MKRLIANLEDLTSQVEGRRFASLIGVSTVMTISILAAGLAGPNDWAAAAALAALQGQSPALADTGADDSAAGALPPPPSAGPGAPSAAPQPQAPAATTPTETTPDDATTTAPPTTTTTPEEPEPPPLPEGTQVKHVFVLSLSSPGYAASFGEQAAAAKRGTADGEEPEPTLMPYLSDTLRPQGLLLDQYSLVDPKSGLPNQIAAVAGQPPNPLTKDNCRKYAEFPKGTVPDEDGIVPGKGCVYPVDALSVADQIASAGHLWRGYAGDMGNAAGPTGCVRPAAGVADETREASPHGEYVSWRNPWIYFHSLVDLGSCGLNDSPLDQLETDLDTADSTASYSFISPAGCDSGAEAPCPADDAEREDGAAADPLAAQAGAADAFLEKWVPQILASKAYKKDGLLIITFGDSSAPRTLKGRDRVGALVLSQFVTPGATDSGKYDAYSLLKATEDFFGVGYLGEARDPKTLSFAFNALGSGD